MKIRTAPGNCSFQLPKAAFFVLAIALAFLPASNVMAATITLTRNIHVTNTYAGGLHPEAGTVTPPTATGDQAFTLYITPNNDYRFSHYTVDGGPDIAATNPFGTSTYTHTFSINTTIDAYFDRAAKVVLTGQPANSASHDRNAVDHSLSPWPTVQLQFEDGSIVQNPASEIHLDIGRPAQGHGGTNAVQAGRPGAVMNGTKAINPGSDGTSHFSSVQIDRVGNNYTVEGWYRIDISGTPHYLYTYERDAGAGDDPGPSDLFDVVAEAGTVLAWGYNQYGQIGNDDNDLGFPGPYSLPILGTRVHPHMYNGSPGWSGGDPYLDAWFVRNWNYPLNTYPQGYDHYQAYQVEGQAFDSRDYQSVAAGQYHSLALASNGKVIVWGNNLYGQLGDGSTTDRHLPVELSLSAVTAVAAGLSHSLALTYDGTVWAWGLNNYGQLGDGTNTNRNSPVQVSGLTDIIAISAGDYHSLALKRDGSVWACGFNSDGELGDGTTTHRTTPVQVHNFKLATFSGHTDNVTSVAYTTFGGVDYAVTGSADGTAKLWDADTGSLVLTFDDAVNGGAHAHTASVNSVAFAEIGAGPDLYVITGSTDKTAKLWLAAQAGTPPTPSGVWVLDFIDTAISTTDAHEAAINTVAFYSDGLPGGTRWVLTGSVDRTAKLWSTDGATASWIRNFIDPDLALLDPSDPSYNKTHEASVGAVLFSADGAQVITGSADKTVKLWTTGTGAREHAFVDAALVAENAGKSHKGSVTSLAYYSDGVPAGTRWLVTGSADHTAKVWHAESGGTLGNLETTFQSFDRDDYLYGHSLGVTSVDISSDGTKVVTGSNDCTAKRWIVATGLIDEDTVGGHTTRATYERHTDNEVLAVAFAGGDATQIITTSTDNTAKFGATPRVVGIDAGAFHNLAVKEDGTVWSWGFNNNGQLGIGDAAGVTTDQHEPVQVHGEGDVGFLTSITAVSAGNAHSLALDGAGEVWAWGYNHYGEVGDESTIQRTTPVHTKKDVGGGDLDNIIAISAGWGYSLARDGTTGTMYAWGHNHHGQLGNDEGYNSTYPGADNDKDAAIEVTAYQSSYRWDEDRTAAWAGDSPMTSISAGYWHSLAIRSTHPVRTFVHWDTDTDEAGFVTKGSVPQTGVGDQATWVFNADGTGTVTADVGTLVYLKAVARPGYRFDHWSGQFAGTDAEKPWVMTEDVNIYVVAHFVREIRRFQLTIERSPEAGGSVSGAGTYDENAEVQVQATANTGYVFSHWTGDSEIENSSINPETVRMTGDKTITAHFVVKRHTLTVNRNPDAGGVVRVNGVVISGGAEYDYGTMLNFEAVPNDGYDFDGWSGALVGTETTKTLTITSDISVTASFIQLHTLTVQADPAEGATFVLNPAGGVYRHGTTVTITAAPETAWQLDTTQGTDGWSGSGNVPDPVGQPLVYEITMNDDETVTAYFTRNYTLSTVVDPPGAGTIGLNPAGGAYAVNTEVTLTATPNDGYRFVNWTGSATGTMISVTVVMDTDKSVTANFEDITNRAGAIQAWGFNSHGPIGDNTTTDRLEPVPTDNLTQVKTIAGGGYHSLALKTNGTVWAWGWNDNGQLGDGSTTERHQPVQVSALTGVTDIAAGEYHSVALKSDGTVWAWGAGGYGQLGNSAAVDKSSPVLVQGLNNVTAVAAGGLHTLALKSDGTVWACGFNNRGQLGDNTTTNRYQVVQVDNLTDVIAIAGGGDHSLALKSDGTVYAWGANDEGQLGLGDGASAEYHQPQQVKDAAGTGNLQNITAIAAGTFHSLALDTSENVWAWGWNYHGQLGQGDSGTGTDRNLPVRVQDDAGDLANITAIDAGYGYSLALKTASATTVWAWGRNAGGALGDGTETDRNLAQQVHNLNTIRVIAAGWFHGMALIEPLQYTISGDWDPAEGGVRIDGLGTYDEGTSVEVTGVPSPGYAFDRWTGDLTGTEATQTVVVDGDKNVTAHFVRDLRQFSLTVTEDGNGTVTRDPDQTLYDAGTEVALTAVPDADHKFDNWSGDLSGSTNPTTIVMDEHKAVTAYFSALSDPRYVLTVVADPVAGGTVSGGGTYSQNVDVVVTATPNPGYRFYYWNDDLGDVTNPKTVTMDMDKTMTAHFVLESYSPGSLLAWGGNYHGQLGDDTTVDKHEPMTVHDLTQVKAMAGGQYHSLALKSDGTVWAWGLNDNGQLGDDTTTERHEPVQVSEAGGGSLTGVTAIAAGADHSLALKSGGTVWAWGKNTRGQLGDGGTTDIHVATQIASLTGVTAIAAGENHSLALKSDGTVWAWGYNGSGQIGNNTTSDQHTPVQVQDADGVLAGITAVACGAEHCLALKSGDTVWAWGYNGEGQLGNGSTDNSTVAVQVKDVAGTGVLSDIKAVAAGSYHSLALTSTNGAVYAWGYNANGQLGDNSTTSRNLPVAVNNLAGDVNQIAADYFHSMALKGDSTVWTWGCNTYGQLGDTTTLDRYEPVQVHDGTGVALTDVYRIAAGWHHSMALVTPSFYTLSVESSPDGGGRVTNAGTYDDGTSVDVEAVPYAGYRFDHWTGDLTDTNPQHTILMDADKSVMAHFVRDLTNVYTLTINVVPSEAAGTVTGAGDYTSSPATVTAVANTGYVWVGWTGGVVLTGGANNEGTVVMDSDKTVTATFAPVYTLTVESSGVADVTINGTPAGTTDYTDSLGENTEVSLTAPETVVDGPTTYQFIHWTLSGVAQTHGVRDLTFNITEDTTVVAVYGEQRTLQVQSSPIQDVDITGTFAVTTNDSVLVGDGASVTLTAPAELLNGTEYDFVRWTLDGADQPLGETTLEFTVDDDAIAVAVYGQRFVLHVQSTPVTGIEISGTHAGTTDYDANVGETTPVSLVAPATYTDVDTDYTFIRWQLNGADQPDGQTTLAFNMAAETTAIAVYGLTRTLNVQSTPVTGIAITSTSGHGDTTNYNVTMADGTAVSLTAPGAHSDGDADYEFVRWTLNGVDQPGGQALLEFSIDADTTAVAVYQRVQRTVTVESTPVTGVGITGTPAGTTDYTADVDDNSEVTLTAPDTFAAADVDYEFTHWNVAGADQTAGEATTTFTINTNTTAIANYQIVQRALTVQSTPVSGLNIAGTPSGTTPYSGDVNDNSAVDLIAPATAADGQTDYEFVRWTRNGVAQQDGVLNVTFDIGADTVVEAVYQRVKRTLTVQSTPITGVAIAGTPAGTTNYPSEVDDNSQTDLTAPNMVTDAGTDYYFRLWRVNGADQPEGQLTLAVAVNAATTVVAVYRDDIVPPAASGRSPDNGVVQVPRNTIVQVHITDDNSGVDAGAVTIEAKVGDGAWETISDGSEEYDATGNTTLKGTCRRSGTDSDYTYTFQANNNLGHEQTVSIRINASDKAVNAMTQDEYSFTTVMRSFGQNARVNSGASTHDHPTTAVDSAGNIWVVWEREGADGKGKIYIAKLPAGGTAFEPEIEVAPEAEPGDRRRPAIAIDSSDNIYVAFQEDDGDPANTWDIFVENSTTADPNTWSDTPPINVTHLPGDQTNPALAADSTGKVYVAWQDKGTGNDDIWVASSNDGATWTETRLTTDTADQTEPAIAARQDSPYTVYVVWTDARNASTDIYGADSATGPWTNVPIVSNANNQSSPVIATESAGTVLHLLWVDDRNDADDIYYKNGEGLAGLAAADDERVTNDLSEAEGGTAGAVNSDQTVPAIAANGTGTSVKVLAGWHDARNAVGGNDDTDIYFAETGSGFGTNILVNDDTGTAAQLRPAIGVDANGDPYLVWADERTVPRNIYYAGATGIAAPAATGLVDATNGGTVEVDGTSPGVCDNADDVIVEIPAGTLDTDTTVTISKVENPPEFPADAFGVPYELGPSGLEFTAPVTVTIPHAAADCPNYTTYDVRYYEPDPLKRLDPLLDPWQRGGISDIEHIVISPTLHAVRFKTTHFSTYATGGSGTAGGGGGGGTSVTWCFIATAAYEGSADEANSSSSEKIAPENLAKLDILRAFRDEVLLPTELGRQFTGWYYALSPPAANQIRQRPAVKQLVRMLLVDPLAAAARTLAEETED